MADSGKHFWEKKEGVKADVSPVASEISTDKKPDSFKKIGNIMTKHSTDRNKRVPTGVEGMDSLIEGGLKYNSAVLIEGGAGCGKSIFGIQFIVNGIEKYGETGVYISFEEEKEPFYENMQRFGWDLKKYEEEEKFAFLRYNPEQVEKVLSGGGGLVRDVVEKLGAARLVIDSMTAFTILHDDELARREATLNLFRTIKKWECTTLVIGQPEFSEYDIDKHPFNVLEFECDGVIRLYNIREHNLRTRTIEVFKMRGTKHASKTFTMEITDKGIVIYPDSGSL
jgi:circadian clock protein KaiC